MNNFEKIVRYGIYAIAIGIGGFAGLFLIKSIIALSVVIVGGLGIINFAPLVSQWFGQMKLKGVKFLSAKNPVEDLQLIYNKKNEQLQETGEAIRDFAVEVKEYQQKLNGFIERRPERANDFKATMENMTLVLNTRKEKYAIAKKKLDEYQQIIFEAQDIWDMSQAALKANRAMKKFDAVDPMIEIRQKTALDAVSSSLNEVMADLETTMSLDYNVDNVKNLSYNPSQVIEMTEVAEKQTVRR